MSSLRQVDADYCLRNGGGVYRNVTFRDLTVRDVNGSVSKKKGGVLVFAGK